MRMKWMREVNVLPGHDQLAMSEVIASVRLMNEKVQITFGIVI